MTLRPWLYAAFLLLLAVCLGAGSDLARIARQGQKQKQEDEKAALSFLDTLARQDPTYYASRAGLKTLRCKVTLSLTEFIKNELRKHMPDLAGPEDWSLEYYWQAPNLSYIPIPPWRDPKKMPVKIIDEPLERIPRSMIELHPYPFEMFHLKYDHDPSRRNPHRLHGVCRSDELKNASLDVYFGADLTIQRFIVVSYLSKIDHRDFVYEPSPAGLLLKSYRSLHQFRSAQCVYQYEYTQKSGYYLPKTILFDRADILDTSIRQFLPLRMDLSDYRINETFAPAIQTHLDLNY